jgi:hypothetical protein
MFKAFTGALSLALAILVLYWVLPEVMVLVAEILVKVLNLISSTLDQVQTTPTL